MHLTTQRQSRSTCCAALMSILLVVPLAGCGSGSSSDPTGAQAKREIEVVGGVVRIFVTAAGDIRVEGETVPWEEFESTLDGLEGLSEVRFFRESPRDDDAHHRGLDALAKIEARGLPLAMYLDPDFEVRASDIR